MLTNLITKTPHDVAIATSFPCPLMISEMNITGTLPPLLLMAKS